MITFLRNHFPALRSEKGFTLIELFIVLIILIVVIFIVIIPIIGFIFGPNYDGVASYEIDGKKIYNFVHLPDEGKIFGVCAGIGYKFGIDPWIPRIGFLAFFLAGGAGVFLYVILWLLTDSAHTPDDYLQRISS